MFVNRNWIISRLSILESISMESPTILNLYFCRWLRIWATLRLPTYILIAFLFFSPNLQVSYNACTNNCKASRNRLCSYAVQYRGCCDEDRSLLSEIIDNRRTSNSFLILSFYMVLSRRANTSWKRLFTLASNCRIFSWLRIYHHDPTTVLLILNSALLLFARPKSTSVEFHHYPRVPQFREQIYFENTNFALECQIIKEIGRLLGKENEWGIPPPFSSPRKVIDTMSNNIPNLLQLLSRSISKVSTPWMN